ncbi:oxidoreductase [Catenaria anguillulae PL171]|uniref:Oxidoreductase n=1 Tax=Catenaria anguillulae PL171 TaxID=765915 RepID=A0A1Y2HAH6_9FUNG|nr:oxidoreductase [Catenaria anguillulae PL171]
MPKHMLSPARAHLRQALNARLPVIAAPMFLVSSPPLVAAACKAGIVGTFPTLNCRTTTQLDQWLTDIKATLAQAPSAAKFGVNLIVHKTNPSLEAHLELVVKHKVPLVITSLGAVKQVIDAVHSYNGLVFHDVTNLRHAAKAVEAGVDGLIAVCAGAGGHAGPASPFALIPQLRANFPDKIIIAGGAISDGSTVRAAQTLGADLAYLGTRFIATKESMAQDGYKNMLVTAKSGPAPAFLPTVYTDKISGVYANFLRDSLAQAGMDPDKLAQADAVEEDFSKLNANESKAWRDVWSAGHGVLNIHDVPTTQQLVDRLAQEYQLAVQDEAGRLAQWTTSAKL